LLGFGCQLSVRERAKSERKFHADEHRSKAVDEWQIVVLRQNAALSGGKATAEHSVVDWNKRL
jgi:hypothetical protein